VLTSRGGLRLTETIGKSGQPFYQKLDAEIEIFGLILFRAKSVVIGEEFWPLSVHWLSHFFGPKFFLKPNPCCLHFKTTFTVLDALAK
jgi:hypothetical protein